MRVLVVEDEQRLASAIERGLADRGFDVVLAHDGRTGYSPDERAIQGGAARGELVEGDQGRSLQGARENNKERSK